jgi:hypothetical protein
MMKLRGVWFLFFGLLLFLGAGWERGRRDRGEELAARNRPQESQVSANKPTSYEQGAAWLGITSAGAGVLLLAWDFMRSRGRPPE